MDKKEISKIIENFAPLNLAEEWDASGWVVDAVEYNHVNKIMLCLTITDKIIQQALQQNCDMIISHHPLFFVPFNYKHINIYCAHTNLDKTKGGTTDTLINLLNIPESTSIGEFLRISNYRISIKDFTEKLSRISNNLRIVNNKNVKEISKIAFCSGSGSEFIQQAFEYGADAFVTGDIKFHTAVESPIVLFDIGHFESEVIVLENLKRLLENEVTVILADEKSPFKTIY